MIVSIFSMLAMGAGAIGQYVQQNPQIVNGLIKQSKPAMKEIGIKTEEIVDEALNGYENDGWQKTEKGIMRFYALPNNKSVIGAVSAVEQFLRTYEGTKVSTEQGAGGSYAITCKTGMNIRKMIGYDMKFTVMLSKKDQLLKVEYVQNVEEFIRAMKAVFLTNAVLGVCKLCGAKERHEVPYKLDEAIRRYLAG